MNAFEEDRSVLSGLHFAQDAMRVHERQTLRLAEAMQRRVEAVLELHRSDQWGDCINCHDEEYPCPTVRAITGEEN